MFKINDTTCSLFQTTVNSLYELLLNAFLISVDGYCCNGVCLFALKVLWIILFLVMVTFVGIFAIPYIFFKELCSRPNNYGNIFYAIAFTEICSCKLTK